MKTMTCKQLGGPCDAQHHGKDHNEVIKAQDRHLKTQVAAGDETHREALAGYRIDDALLDRAAPDAIALHCLPAHPGEEITEEVLYGPRQRIWDQAENRRHAQKALLEWLVEAL